MWGSICDPLTKFTDGHEGKRIIKTGTWGKGMQSYFKKPLRFKRSKCFPGVVIGSVGLVFLSWSSSFLGLLCLLLCVTIFGFADIVMNVFPE